MTAPLEPGRVAIRSRTRLSTQSTANPIIAADANAAVAQMQIKHLPTGALRPPPVELRKADKRQQPALKASIKAFGIVKPILVDENVVIVAGYSVWKAAKALNIKAVPTLCISHLTPEQIRLYRIADNQIATLSSFDEEMLRVELGELAELSLHTVPELNLELTGFATAEIDNILLSTKSQPEAASQPDEPDLDSPEIKQAVSRLGDLWIAGDHRIVCGNSMEEVSYAALMAGELAQMVVADPPYNVIIGGHVSGRKGAREFAFASGEMSSAEFTQFLLTGFRLCVKFSVDGSIHYHAIDWRHVWEMLSAGREAYTEHKQILVWAKTNASMGWYRSQHELICVFKNGTAPHIDNFGLGDTGRYRTNLLTHPGSNTFRKGRDEDLAAHPTVKNFSLIADLIRDCSTRGGIILDNFGGAGTAMAAAEWTGRRARLIEIDPVYVDVTLRRWMKQSGGEPILEATGQTFSEVAAERGVAEGCVSPGEELLDPTADREGDDDEA